MRKLQANKVLVPLLLACLMVACKPSIPRKYIQPDKLEAILYDCHLAQGIAQAETYDAHEREMNELTLREAVFKKHGVTKAEFDSSMVYYFRHTDKISKIYYRLSKRMSNDAMALGASASDVNKYVTISNSGDTANIWTATSHVLLIPRPTKNRFEFTIKADSTFRVGDSFMFQFMTEHIWQTGSKDAVVCLCAAYEGDSIMQVVSHSSVSGIVQLRLPANRTQKFRELRGFIYLTSDGEETDSRKLMFVSQIQLIRFHNKEIQEKYEQAKQDSAYKAPHSMSRGDISDRQQQDTTGRGADERLRSQSAPFRRGGGKH